MVQHAHSTFFCIMHCLAINTNTTSESYPLHQILQMLVVHHTKGVRRCGESTKMQQTRHNVHENRIADHCDRSIVLNGHELRVARKYRRVCAAGRTIAGGGKEIAGHDASVPAETGHELESVSDEEQRHYDQCLEMAKTCTAVRGVNGHRSQADQSQKVDEWNQKLYWNQLM